MFRHLLRPVVRTTRRGTRAYHEPVEYKYPSMNELPIPSGSWQEHYNKMQRIYNMQLIGSVVTLAATIAFARATGLIYLNAFPPTPDE